MTPSGTVDAWKPYTRGDGGQGPSGGNLGEVMRVILDVVQGPLKGRQFIFDRHDTFIVGRSRFVHCPMPEDLALSRDHFMIEINPPHVRAARPGEHQRDVREQPAGGPGPAGRRGDLIAAGQSVFRVAVRVGGDDLIVRGTEDVDAGTAVAGDRRGPISLRRLRGAAPPRT